MVGLGVTGVAESIHGQAQECQPRGVATIAYQASTREVVVTPFADKVFGRFHGMRLAVDLSDSGIVLPRGVWWVNAQPMDLSPFGDAGFKIVTNDGRVVHDTLFMVDEQTYDNAWNNMIGGRGVWGWTWDGQFADDFVVREREASIGTVVADLLTVLGHPPADGVWVQFYSNLCPTPILDPPVPGRAGEVNEWHVTGLRPADVVHFVYGLAPGEFPIPGCGSIAVSIANPVYMGSATADTEGNAVFARFVPAYARGRQILMQAHQRTTCLTSNVVTHTFE